MDETDPGNIIRKLKIFFKTCLKNTRNFIRMQTFEESTLSAEPVHVEVCASHLTKIKTYEW